MSEPEPDMVIELRVTSEPEQQPDPASQEPEQKIEPALPQWGGFDDLPRLPAGF